MTTSGPVWWVCPAGHGAPGHGYQQCPTCGAALVQQAAASAYPPPAGYAPAGGYAGSPAPVPPAGYPPAGYPQQAPGIYPPPAQGITAAPAVPVCATCGGNGAGLPDATLVCPTCHWLRPLAPGYFVDPAAFMWAQDGAAMAKLRSIGPLNAAARTISDKIGRPWVESTYNGVRIGENQLPELWRMAVRAARLLGMPKMPDIYITGEKMWDAVTFGSDNSSFILLGTAVLNSFRGDDLLFLLAREMGHCRAGHALWKTVGTLLVGEQGPRKGVLAGGLVAALNPDRLVAGAIEMPLMAWARQSEITADRAGLLAVGDEEVARRVLLSWALKSIHLYRMINIDAWMQQEEDTDATTQLAEMLTSPTPYITRRLKTLTPFARSPELAQMRAIIQQYDHPSVEPSRDFVIPGSRPAGPPARDPNALQIACTSCKAPIRIPRRVLEGKNVLNVRCPNTACGKITTLRRGPASSERMNDDD